MTKISVVVLHVKNAAMTGECLASLEKLKVRDIDLSLIIVDNASEDDFSGYKSKWDFIFIKNEKNLGYAGGNNVGIKRALEDGAEYVWILNNDTVVDPHCLQELVIAAQRHPSGGIFGAKIYFAPGYEFHKEKYKKSELGKVLWWAGGEIDWNNVMTKHRGVDEVDINQYAQEEKTGAVTGTAMLVTREVFEKIGLLDEKYFLYFEESDFCLRALRAGFELWYVPTAVVWHKNAGSSGAGSDLHDYYTTRNRLLFGLLYAPLKSKIALGRQAIGFLFSGRPWQKKGVKDFLTINFGKGCFPA
ncbi:glycosyltransferase family 2 protein [Patescibacteria group bacterium]|nr:glycosyltransferase family 2 protein [Patescibacteria group bacterium]